MILLFFTTATDNPITGISCMMDFIPASAFSGWACANAEKRNMACNRRKKEERIFFIIEFNASNA